MFAPRGSADSYGRSSTEPIRRAPDSDAILRARGQQN